jgi:tRNA A37 threonylcarbamoyltransferase TsaD
MRYFRQLCALIALVCVLAVSTSAGDMSCGIVHSTGDISCGMTHETPAESQEYAGHIPCGSTGDMPNGVESTDTVTELVISLLTTVLPLI